MSAVVLGVFGVLFSAAVFLFWYLIIPLDVYQDEHPPGGPSPRLFPAAVGPKWGFIDQTGTMVVPLLFTLADRFSEGLARVELNGKVAYIDDFGRVALIVEGAEYGRAFSNGLAEVRVGDLWGFIDRSGAFVIKPQFQWTFPFQEGIALVRTSAHSAYYPIDKTGRPLSISPPDGDCEFVFFREGLNECLATNGLSGYIGHSGRWMINPIFGSAGNFSEGLAYARLSGKRARWGYIDPTGRWAIDPQFLAARSFNEGLAAVRVCTWSFPPFKWGFIDSQGRMVIPPAFDDVMSFCGGLCAVQKGTKVGFIDRTGQIVIPFQFYGGGYFHGPLAPVIYTDESGKDHLAYLNRKGQIIWASPNVVGRL